MKNDNPNYLTQLEAIVLELIETGALSAERAARWGRPVQSLLRLGRIAYDANQKKYVPLAPRPIVIRAPAKRAAVNSRIDADKKARLDAIAKSRGVDVSHVLREWIDTMLASTEATEPATQAVRKRRRAG